MPTFKGHLLLCGQGSWLYTVHYALDMQTKASPYAIDYLKRITCYIYNNQYAVCAWLVVKIVVDTLTDEQALDIYQTGSRLPVVL